MQQEISAKIFRVRGTVTTDIVVFKYKFFSTPQSRCLLDHGSSAGQLDHSAEGALPGERFDASQQCKYLRSYYYPCFIYRDVENLLKEKIKKTAKLDEKQ